MWFLTNGPSRIAALACVVVASVPAAGNGQIPSERDTSGAVTLESILGSVRMDNPDLKASQLDAVADLERSRQVALPDPSVMVTYFPEPVYTARGSQQWQFRAEQQFPFPGKLSLQRRASEVDAEASRFRTAEMEDRLLFEAKRAYYKLYRVARQQALIREFQDQLSGFEEVASTRYEVGEGPQQAILKAQLERSMLSSRLIGLEDQRRTAETVLARLQDRDQVARIEPILEMALPEAPKRPIDSLVATALDRRPVVGAIDASSRAADYRIQLAGKQLLPDFGLSITYFGIGNESIPASADGKNALAVAASVRVPLYRKSKRAGIESARVKRRQLDWDRQAIEADLRTRITELVSRIDQEAAQVRLFETILIPKAQSTLDATSNEYATGRMGFLDLLDAERMLFTLRTSLEDSTERYLVAVSELERTIGIGSLSEITD